MDLGSTIKRIRKEKRLNQIMFSSQCGITQPYLSRIENNEKDPNFRTLKIIGEKLGIPLPILFYLSMTDDDIPEEKRNGFEVLNQSVKALINEFFNVKK